MQTENMTVKEVADFLRVSRQTMYAMLRNKVDIHNKIVDLYGELLR